MVQLFLSSYQVGRTGQGKEVVASFQLFLENYFKKASVVFPPGLGFPRKNLVYCVAMLSM